MGLTQLYLPTEQQVIISSMICFNFSYENQTSYWWETNFLVDEKSILNVDVVRGRWRENLYDGRPAGNLVYLFLLPSYVLHICHRTQYQFPETQS